jgi:hypothetical protein
MSHSHVISKVPHTTQYMAETCSENEREIINGLHCGRKYSVRMNNKNQLLKETKTAVHESNISGGQMQMQI